MKKATKAENSKAERKQPTREEILERKVTMAKERNSRVMKISSPMGGVMFNILRQFDAAYNKYMGRCGLPGGMADREVFDLIDQTGLLSNEFSELTQKLCKKVKYRYYTPEELKFYNNQIPDQVTEEDPEAQKQLDEKTEVI